MEPDGRHEIPASYALHPEHRAQARARHLPLPLGAALAVTAVIAVAALWAAAISIVMLLHARNVSSAQAAQLRALGQSNTRLAGEVAALGHRQAQLSAQVAAADPAADASLITCTDLRRLRLMAATGGSVSAVPGTVSLTQSPVPLPEHCSSPIKGR
jgi:hypothetical protein